MRAEDRIRLLHMVEASQTAMRFVSGRERSDLQADQMLLFAVVRAIEVLGEAASCSFATNHVVNVESIKDKEFN